MNRIAHLYKRYCVICNIRKKINKLDQMGGYRFIGEWGERLKKRYNRLVCHYNKFSFFWQKRKHVIQ